MQNFAKKAQIFGEDFFNEKCKTISPLRCVGYYKINFLNLVEQFVMTLLELESKDSHESITKYRELIKQYLCAQFCAGLSIGLVFLFGDTCLRYSAVEPGIKCRLGKWNKCNHHPPHPKGPCYPPNPSFSFRQVTAA